MSLVLSDALTSTIYHFSFDSCKFLGFLGESYYILCPSALNTGHYVPWCRAHASVLPRQIREGQEAPARASAGL